MQLGVDRVRTEPKTGTLGQLASKQELYERLEALVSDVRDRSRWFISFAPLPSMTQGFDELAARCIDIQKAIVAASDEPANILELKKQVLDMEINFRRLSFKVTLLPATIGVYVGFAVLFLLVRVIDIPHFVRDVFRIEAPERLISLGVAGAFIYLATSVLTRLERQQVPGRQGATPANFAIRLVLAIIVPIVLVALFFKPDGTIGEPTVTPELLSFGMGFSAKLAIDIFNKVVEKVSKTIEAL